jgi:hypothetical protein
MDDLSKEKGSHISPVKIIPAKFYCGQSHMSRQFGGFFMKKTPAFLLALTMLIISTACGDRPEETVRTNDDDISIVLVNTHFEEYAYQSNLVEFPSSGEFIQAVLAHENRIYSAHFESNSQNASILVLTGFNPDGSDIKRIEMQSPGNEVASFNITNDGNFAFYIFNRAFSQQRHNINAYYVEYNSDGAEITRKEFGEFTLIENPQPNTFVVLNDRRILSVTPNENVLQELNFDSGQWGESLLLNDSTVRVRGIFPAQKNSPYDFLISDDSFLYGYNIENNEQTILLSWTQSGFADSFVLSGILDDGRIFVLTRVQNTVYELYILTPIHRNEAPEQKTITIGGISV